MAENDVFILKSNDGEEFQVSRKAMEKSEVVSTMIDNLGGSPIDVIPFEKISGAILKLVVDWLIHHAEDPETNEENNNKDIEIPVWDREFLEKDQKTIFKIIEAANYLNIQLLLDMCCKAIANMIKGKRVDEIRTEFKIKNDFSAEEEKKLREENAWCEEE